MVIHSTQIWGKENCPLLAGKVDGAFMWEAADSGRMGRIEIVEERKSFRAQAGKA